MKHRQLAFVIAMLFSAPSAFATNGYFSHGVGVRAQGIGGAGIALPQDGLAAATNPAGTAFLADRVDLGLTWFNPKREAKITGNTAGLDGTYDGNGTSNFYIPEIGLIRHLDFVTAGVAVYGNGGMNTDYAKNPYFGTGHAGVNLEQLFVTPSVAYRVNDQHALGLALNFAYQRFSAEGLDAFTNSSASGTNLTNKGTDSATGYGLRLGWTGQITPQVTVAATWASKVATSKFSKYSGLFAEGGGFDIPANYGIGLAYQATKTFTIAADLQQIQYSGVKSVANPLSNLFAGNALGSANGPGFGWKDVTVVKLGGSYDWNDTLTVRAGYNHSTQPIPDDQTFFNILAPGVIQDHLTLGATWKTSSGEISAAYTHGFKKTVHGSNSIPAGNPPAGFGGGNADISLEENILGVAYSWKL